MTPREKFDLDIQAVQNQLLEICQLSISALEKSFKALIEKDMEAALAIIKGDSTINRLEEAINDQVILIIAKQQPVARDLRRLMVMIKAATDMERVGDYAVNIANETIRIGDEPIIFQTKNLEIMCEKTVSMLSCVVEAFITEDIIKAKEVAELDDYIDDLYGATVVLLMRLGAEKPALIKQVTHLSFVCRHLERAADHATNIAEHLIYLVKGQHYELNS